MFSFPDVEPSVFQSLEEKLNDDLKDLSRRMAVVC